MTLSHDDVTKITHLKCLTGRTGSLSANARKLLDESEDRKLKELGEAWPKVNTLRPRPNDRHFADDIFKCIFLKENLWISTKISLKYVRHGLIDKKSALVQKMASPRTGDKRIISSPPSAA